MVNDVSLSTLNNNNKVYASRDIWKGCLFVACAFRLLSFIVFVLLFSSTALSFQVTAGEERSGGREEQKSLF